eukprot:1138959-Pelagomonas_calceolata.AAC.2
MLSKDKEKKRLREPGRATCIKVRGEKKSPGVQEYGKQPSRSPLALLSAPDALLRKLDSYYQNQARGTASKLPNTYRLLFFIPLCGGDKRCLGPRVVLREGTGCVAEENMKRRVRATGAWLNEKKHCCPHGGFLVPHELCFWLPPRLAESSLGKGREGV